MAGARKDRHPHFRRRRAWRRNLGIGLALAIPALWDAGASSITGHWIFDGAGAWTAPSNWLGGVPNAMDDIADFTFNISAARTVTLDTPITLGGLILGDALGAQGFTFAGSNALTFAASSGNAFVNKYNSATDVWQAPLTLNSSLHANISAGTLDVNGAGNTQVLLASAGAGLVKNGSGALRLNIDSSAYQGDWVVNLGTLNVGGANNDSATSLGTGAGDILLNGAGSAGLAVFSLNNNGSGSGGEITYAGSHRVVLQGAATINVDRNFINGANANNTIVLGDLTMNGGILGVTGANGYALRFNGVTSLAGDTNVFSPTTAALTLGGAITDGANSRALIKESSGRLVIASSANSYDGATVVKDGFLQLAAGANLGTGAVFVNGGALSLADASQTGAATMPGGLNLVAQIGTSRAVLPVIGNTDFAIDSGNPLNLPVPIFGMVLGIDADAASDIDLSQVGGAGSARVSMANIGGVDRTYSGTLSPAIDNTIRLHSAANSLILSADGALGGASSSADLIIGLAYANPLVLAGVTITQGNTGTVSVRADNATTLGTVTVNRGVTLNINGAITTPIGNGVVTALGGTISTDNTSAAQFGNTDFRLFGGSTLLLDNSAVTTANADRRLQNATNVTLTSSTLRMIGDGGAVTTSTQGVVSIGYSGGSTISVDTDGTAAGRLTTLATGELARGITRGTLNIRNISNTTATFGTASGTQKLTITGAPAGMMNAGIALWGGTTANDASLAQFATYDAANGVQAVAFGVTATTIAQINTSTSATVLDINGINGANTMNADVSALAARLRTTAGTQLLNNGGFTLNIGASAAAGQGAGLFVTHTSNDAVTHTANFNFGTQEGLLFAATTGGTSGVIVLNGVISGSNGVTRFGDGILTLGGANTFTGPLTINAGETRLNNVSAGGSVTGAANDVNLWGGLLFLNAASTRHNNDVTFLNDARLGNVNVAGAGFNNLAVGTRTGSTAPIVLDLRNQSGSNVTTAYGNLTLNGPAQAYVTHPFQIDGALSGAGRLEKFGNERLFIGGDSSGYSQPVTINTGFLVSINAASTAKPFGTGAITVNPGGSLRLAAATNINPGQLTVNSDYGAISGIGMTFVADPAALPAFTLSSGAPWKAVLGISAAGFSQNVNQATLWGGGTWLGSMLGDSGTFTGTLTPAGSTYRLGTGQGTLRVASSLTGSGNSVQIGVSMTGDAGRADQAVNNSGGTVEFDVPMTYGGATVINTNASLRVSASNALSALGAITLNGGTLQFDSTAGQLRMIAPLAISNALNMSADGTIQMQNNAGDARLTGALRLAPGSTGVVRTFTVGIDGSNAGQLYLDGGVTDGAGGAGNHLVKAGQGAAFLTGPNTFSGSTTVTGGFLAVNSNADFGNTSQLVLSGGGLAAWENSFTLNRGVSINGGVGYFDVQAGLTLTQAAGTTIDGGGAGTNNGFLAKRGLGTLVLNGRNAQPGLLVLDGVLQVNSQAALGDPARAGATDIQFGGDFAIGGTTTATRYTGGTLRINDTLVTTRGITFNNNASSVYAGGIDVTGTNFFTVTSPIAQGTEFDFWFKTGTGTLIATGANTFRQAAFTNGTYQFGTSTPWTNSTSTAADNTVLEWIGGTIRAANANSNITLANGSSTTTYNYGGGMHLQMESGLNVSIEFGADNLLRQNQGALVLEAANATTLGAAGNTNAARLIPANIINPGVARASAVVNGIFAPHLIAADGSGTANFTTNDAATGIRPYGGATIATLSGDNAAGIGDITGTQTLAGINRIYAFRTTADVNGGTLSVSAVDNLNTGGILINGSNTIGSNVVFDPASAAAPGSGTPGEGLIYVKTGENATLAGALLANALTKFGRGTLTLSGSGAVLGDVSVQDGTLTLDGGTSLSRMDSELNINSGAALDLNGTSIAVETIGSNNRQVTGTGGSASFGGSITNGSATAATLSMAGPQNSTFTGTIDGNLKLMKAGSGVLTIDAFRASTPDSGNNTFTGGTDIYGVGTTGGVTLDNAVFGLGGAGGAAGAANLFSGTLSILYTGNATTFPIASGTNGQQYNNLTVRIGADGTNGINLNVKGPGLINVNRGVGAVGQGNIMQIGSLNMTDTTLQLSGANLYRMRVAGATTIQGAQAAFQTNSDGPGGALELAGPVAGAGVLSKLGDGSMRGIVIASAANTYSGGTNIIAGDVQVTATGGTPLGSGPVRVFPDGTLRLAGNGSVDGAKLTVLSRVNALGVVGLDDNFNPTVLTAANFGSAYHTALQLSQPFFTQPLDLAAIGDGRAFLISGLAQEVKYMAPTLGAGVPDAWNPAAGVYRLAGGVNNLAFDGTDNVLTGATSVQIGPQRNNVLGAATNTGNTVLIRNSNNFSGGTQITEGTTLAIETGGSPVGDTPLGTGGVEVYGTLLIQGNLGSMFKATAAGNANNVILRPAGTVRIIDAANLVAGNNGRWGDSANVDLNGGTFRYDGAANYQSVETIGAVTARKGGILSVLRNSAASSAQLNVAALTRADRGVLTISYNSGFLGLNTTRPQSYERLVVNGGVSVGGTITPGAGVINPGIAAPWIIDRVTNSFVGYDTTGAGTGFQPLVSAAPGAGEIAYSKIVSGSLGAGGLTPGDIADFTTVTKTLADNPTLYALRTSQTVNPTAGSNTLTLTSGGLIMTGGTINPTGAITAGVVSPMTLNFGAAGAGEALAYVGGTSVIQAQINAAQGFTKFGSGQLIVQSINPGLGDAVVVNEGTLIARVPVPGTGGAVGTVFNGQDVILNAGALHLVPQIANAAGTATELAGNAPVSGSLGSNVFVRGDATLGNNSATQYARIGNLTVANDAASPAMNGNGVITLALQSGIWVGGTTTLSPQARINGTFAGFSQATLAGQVTGSGGVLEKFGNGVITMLGGANNYDGGTIINGTTNATATSGVASAFRGAGTPFGSGSITVNPGGVLRLADNANIAGNAVTMNSDGYGLAAIGLAHNGALPAIITSGAPAAGQIKAVTAGPFGGALTLDYGYYGRPLDMAGVAGGDWWLGNSTQAEAYYFNASLGANANGKYQLGAGGNQNAIEFGGVLVSGGRVALFENVFSGGAAGSPRIEVGALTGDFVFNAPSFVNGNSAGVGMALLTRNTNLTGDVRVNTNSTLNLGNNFALGNGRLVLNGGNLRFDTVQSITINNSVLLTGDFSTSNANDFVIKGGVVMHDAAFTAGATRLWNLGGTGTMGVTGVISGADGSNLIKTGMQFVVFAGSNTYQGYTQINNGEIIVQGDVLPGQSGPLGVSDSPVVLGAGSGNTGGTANVGGGIGIGGRFTFGRDIILGQTTGTGAAQLENRTNETAVVTGAISLISTGALTLRNAGADQTTFRGGLLDVQGVISGAGSVNVGSTGAAPDNAGIIRLSASANGYGTNTYGGGTTLQTARLQIASDAYFSGPAAAPVILSGPIGTGPLTFGPGESNRGGAIEAIGGPRIILNALGAMNTAANTTVTFSGREALTFTRSLDLNSDTSMRARTFNAQNLWASTAFSGNLSNSSTNGAGLFKIGAGTLVLTGTNTQANRLITDANYGSGVIVDAGILRVNSDAALGSALVAAAGGQHLINTPADLRLRSPNALTGGTLSVSNGFSTARRLIFGTTATSGASNAVIAGIDVAGGQTFTLTAPAVLQTGAVSAATLIKTGPGTLALNAATNAQTALIMGGQSQQNPALGPFSHTGGVVSTTATGGSPFVNNAGTNMITINSGTLSLVGGGSAQALSAPRISYGPAAHIALSQGATSSSLTMTDAAFTSSMRGGAVSGFSTGTLIINPTALANLGGTERFLIPSPTTALFSPQIVAAVAGTAQDASFLRYDTTNGFIVYTSPTVTTLAATAPGIVGDISAPDQAGAGIIDVAALRTSADISPTDGTTLVRINNGGLIMNGAVSPVISANVFFGTNAGATEGLVYVRDGQSAYSKLAGNVTAGDLTKFGPGSLELSGGVNVLNGTNARLPVASVQEGTLRFANTGALFRNGLRDNDAGLFIINVNENAVFDLNGLNLSIAGLAGNGTITSGSGSATFTVRNIFGGNTAFNGSIVNGTATIALAKSGDGTLTLGGYSSYTGGTGIQAGRVLSGIPLPLASVAPAITAALGGIDARNPQALGTGPITLNGGILAINNNVATTEIEDGIDFNTFGPGNGYDITISSIGLSNGVTMPANSTSTININSSNTATLTSATGINSLTIDAPAMNLAGLATNSGNLGLLFVKGATTFSNPNTVFAVNGARLFLGGQVQAAGKTITKIGAQDIVLTHTDSGGAQSQVGLWKVYGGTLNARVADGASNPLGSNATVELNGGTTGTVHLNLNSDGNGTALAERITTFQDTTVRFGSLLPVTSSDFVMTGASRLNADRLLTNNSNKTFALNSVQVGGALGSAYAYFTGGNGDSFWVGGPTSFTRDLYLQNDVAVTLNGPITGSGTFLKRFGTTLYVNADNTNGYNSGTVITGTPILFGSLEGNQITLNDTAKLGTGHVVINPNGQLQFNSAGNLQAGQNVYVSSNLDNFGVLRLAANLTLDQVNFRAAGVGGAPAAINNYYLTSTNPGGGVLALNAIWTNALDLRALGDGTWYLGSTGNAVGANGSYDAPTLAPGFNNTYRLGAGGATLFFGSNGNSNVVTNVDASSPAGLLVGAPMSLQNNGIIGNGSGNVVFLTSQNYTGTTVVNRLSTLDFRGTLNTSSIETYGGLNVAGEQGTFLIGGSGANIPVTLRPGATLRFDNASAGVPPVTATQGRWEDAASVTLDNATLRLQGNAAVEVSETVGAITAKGGSFIEVVRGVIGRTAELRTSGITRVGAGTITFNTNSDMLGSDERVIVTGTAPAVINGMVAPWMVSNTNTEFITYNADTGFSKAGFTKVQTGGTTGSTLSLANDRVLFNTANTVIGTGFDINAHAARLDTDITLQTASNNTASANRLILGSGGLITNGARTINAGLWFGSGGTSEALIFNNNTLNIGDTSNLTTSGQIAAASITKSGSGTLVLQAVQGSFAGNINVNQGALTLNYAPPGASGSVFTTPTVNVGGGGGTIILNGPNVTLNLLGGNDAYAASVNTIFNNSVTIADYNPIVQLVANRSGGSITNRRVVIGGDFTFGANSAETGQIVRFTSGNTFDFQLGDAPTDLVTLTGKSVFDVDNGGTAGQPDLTVTAKVTGVGTLVKSRIDTSSDVMLLENVTAPHDWSGGTIVAGGTLRVYARAGNVAAGASTNLTAGGLGTGAVTLMGGTLDLRVDNDGGGTPDTNAERTFFSTTGNGLNLTVGGSATINVDRTGLVANGTTKQIAFNNLSIGSQILTVAGGNTYGLEIAGTTALQGNLFLNNSVDTIFSGAIDDGGAGLFIHKVNTGALWVNTNANSLGGGAFIQAGLLRFGTPRGASATAQIGSGTITINPGAQVRIEAMTNLNTAAGQIIRLVSTPYSPAVFRTASNAVTGANVAAVLAADSDGIVSLEGGGTFVNNLDQSAIGAGRTFLAATASTTYSGNGIGSLAPGLANSPDSVVGGGSANRVYRLGGSTTAATLTVDLAGSGNLGDVGGPTDVQIGSLATLGPTGSLGSGQVLLADQNTYTGSTIVVRGSIARFSSASDAGDAAGPLGIPGAAAIHVYGTLRAEGTNGTFVNAGNSGNAYTNVVLHPGGELRLQDAASLGAASDRWHDITPIALNGALLTLQTANSAVDAAETVGAISFERGSRIQAVTQSTARITLSMDQLTRVDRGTMLFIPSAVNRLGIAPASNSERILISAPPANAAGTNMMPGWFGVQVENRFATYGANGIAPVADAQMVPYAPGLPAGSIVNVQANTTLLDSPTVFALRIGGFTLSSITGANNDSSVTFSGSGADIGGIITSGAATIHPNLKFGVTGGNEALINTVGGTLTLNGFIDAGTVTKFGANTLVIANDQSDAARGTGRGYANGWVVNEGTLQLNAFGSTGNAVAGNTVTLNGSQIGAATLNLRAQPQTTLLNYSYSLGRIIAVDNATIDWDPGADDRVHSIGAIEIQQAGGAGALDAQLRVANNRARSILSAGQLTLTNNAILNVDTTADRSVFYAYTTNNANLTTGTSSGMSVASLNGSARLTKWGDGYLYVRGASPGFSGKVVIDQGAVQVNHNNALGSGDVSVNRYGVLDVAVAGYVPTNSSITYNDASSERWSVDGARIGTLDLGKGTLQVAVSQTASTPGTLAVMLDGGSIEGWLRSDDVTETNRNSGVFRTIGAGISFTLAGNSKVGTQFYEGANGLDMGKQANDFRPLEEYFGSGVILDVKGPISGPGSLTKTGYEPVILSGQNTYAGGTTVTMGRLLVGRANALPQTGDLLTHASGILDLNGFDQTVARLANPASPATPSLTSGFITNSAAIINTLTVGNGVSTNFTYSGVIQSNVALTKSGSGILTLNNADTYRGKTTVSQGTLTLASNASIDDSPWVSIGSAAIFDVSTKAGGYMFDGVVSGGGTDPANTSYGTVVASARISGHLRAGDHLGEISGIGRLSPGASSLAADRTTAGDLIGHLYTNGDLTLAGALAGSAPAQPVIRLTLQLDGPTSTFSDLGYTGGDMAAFIDGLPTGTSLQQGVLRGTQGTLANHDYLNIGGTLTLSADGRIAIDDFGSYSPVPGDIFNLMDWGAVIPNGFDVGNRYQNGSESGNDLILPLLGPGLAWDTSLFVSEGIIAVVPEPSGLLLLLLGISALGGHRHRSTRRSPKR